MRELTYNKKRGHFTLFYGKGTLFHVGWSFPSCPIMVKQVEYKVFVVGGNEHSATVRASMQKVQARGLIVTLDYLALPELNWANPDAVAKRTILYETAAADSDALLCHIPDPQNVPLHVAALLGMALVLGKRVLIATNASWRPGTALSRSPFTYHPNVTVCTSEDEALACLPVFPLPKAAQ